MGKERHGMTGTKIYRLWCRIKERCYNKNAVNYRYYGGRGIVVCEDWRDSAIAFMDWAVRNGWKPGLQIDRINNDGDYDSTNCRFVTSRENNLNQRLIRSDNTSGFVGIHYHKSARKYQSCVKVNGKEIYLGLYIDPVKAAQARNNYIIENNLKGYIIQYIPDPTP